MSKQQLISAGTGQPSLQVPTRLLGVPLMVSRAEADLILAALTGPMPAGMFFGLFDDDRPKTYAVKNGMAVLPVMGGLIYRGYGWSWRTTYGQVRKQFREALVDPEVSAILFDIDSPGGEVAGVMDLVDEIYAARGQKPIYAVANENAFSAAYAIASAADKIYLPRTGSMGSVGVIAIHYEQAEAEAMAGVKYTAIFAGSHKNDFTMHEPLSDKARAVAQASVDKSYDLFVATVARNRGVDAQQIRDQQASIYDGNDAVTAGLADAVMNIEEILAAHGQTNTSSKGGNQMDFENIFNGLAALLTDKDQKKAAMEKLTRMGFVPDVDHEAAQQALAEAEANGKQAGIKEERARAVAITEKCVLAGCTKMAPQLVGEEIDVEAAATRIAEAKHNNDQTQDLDNNNSGLGAAGADYLIADAKRRAGEK